MKMLSKHFILSVSLHILVFLGCSFCLVDTEKSQSILDLEILRNVVKLTDNLLEVTPHINITISSTPPNCLQMMCKFVCFNGRASEIDHDIDVVASKNNITCNRIEELRLYSYDFPDNKLSYGFLGTYSNKVETLYVACSNVSDVDTGTFANGVFQKIYFEDLKLVHLKKDFFQGITNEFSALSVIQKETPLNVVNGDFLDYVKYQIKYLTMQVGLSCIRNLTGSENLLNNLIHVDFSYNNFGNRLTKTVFSKLSMVEHIDLSHSNLESLESYIFADFTTTLEYLDLSYNKLKTLSRTIFGYRDLPRDLKIYANNNEWQCSCDLQTQMKEIFVYQTTQLVCSGPEVYGNWSVFDERMCEKQMVPSVPQTTTTAGDIITTTHPSVNGLVSDPYSSANRPSIKDSTPSITKSTTMVPTGVPLDTIRPDLFELQCLADNQRDDDFRQQLQWPSLEFNLLPQEQLRVDVIIEKPSNSYSWSALTRQELNESFALIWFSKVTTQYYKMEINYNEYGLGCYNAISYVTTVGDLIPNVAYTFCMVLKDQLTISPFNCKSIHVGGNLSVRYSAWLTRDMKVTGLSLVVFGIVMFSFAGLLLIYILLKRKPILLKGSKRVTMMGKNDEDIVVMPRAKSFKSIKEKECKLAKKGMNFCSERRRNSSESVDSYQSYMNANLYEVIPAYSQINSNSLDSSAKAMTITSQVNSPDLEKCEYDCSYITPLNTVSSSADLVNYAEIPYRSKRVSNDPLPEVPSDQEPFYGTSLQRKDYPDVGVIYMLDSQV